MTIQVATGTVANAGATAAMTAAAGTSAGLVMTMTVVSGVQGGFTFLVWQRME